MLYALETMHCNSPGLALGLELWIGLVGLLLGSTALVPAMACLGEVSWPRHFQPFREAPQKLAATRFSNPSVRKLRKEFFLRSPRVRGTRFANPSVRKFRNCSFLKPSEGSCSRDSQPFLETFPQRFVLEASRAFAATIFSNPSV